MGNRDGLEFPGLMKKNLVVP